MASLAGAAYAPDVERFKLAWKRVRPAAFGWALTYFVFAAAMTFSYGLALVVLPNLIRATRAGVEAGTGPDVGMVFEFDSIAEDAVAMLILLLLCTIAAIPNPALAIVPIVALSWTPILMSERTMNGTDAIKTSAIHVRDHFLEVASFLGWAALLNLLGAATCVGWVFTLPATIVAALTFHEERRDELVAAAQAANAQQGTS